MRKWTVITLYVLIAAMLLIYREPIVDWLRTDQSEEYGWAILILAFLIALIPAIPYAIIAVMLGAKYGAITGGITNLLISSLAAVALFIIVRYVFTSEQRKKAAGIKGLSVLTAYTERNPFYVVLIARLLPIVPAQAINMYAALTQMRLLTYTAATVIGKIPFLLAASILGNEL